MEYFVTSAKFVPLKYYTLSSQLQRLASFSVGCSGRRILSPGQINIMRKWCIDCINVKDFQSAAKIHTAISDNIIGYKLCIISCVLIICVGDYLTSCLTNSVNYLLCIISCIFIFACVGDYLTSRLTDCSVSK